MNIIHYTYQKNYCYILSPRTRMEDRLKGIFFWLWVLSFETAMASCGSQVVEFGEGTNSFTRRRLVDEGGNIRVAIKGNQVVISDEAGEVLTKLPPRTLLPPTHFIIDPGHNPFDVFLVADSDGYLTTYKGYIDWKRYGATKEHWKKTSRKLHSPVSTMANDPIWHYFLGHEDGTVSIESCSNFEHDKGNPIRVIFPDFRRGDNTESIHRIAVASDHVIGVYEIKRYGRWNSISASEILKFTVPDGKVTNLVLEPQYVYWTQSDGKSFKRSIWPQNMMMTENEVAEVFSGAVDGQGR